MIMLSSFGLSEIEIYEMCGGLGTNFKVQKSNITFCEWSNIRRRAYDILFTPCLSYYIFCDYAAKDIWTKTILSNRDTVEHFYRILISYFQHQISTLRKCEELPHFYTKLLQLHEQDKELRKEFLSCLTEMKTFKYIWQTSPDQLLKYFKNFNYNDTVKKLKEQFEKEYGVSSNTLGGIKYHLVTDKMLKYLFYILFIMI